jgi:hypothetical protein
MHTYTLLKSKNHNLLTVAVSSNNQGDQILYYRLERNNGSICHFHDSHPEGEYIDCDEMENTAIRIFQNEPEVKKALKLKSCK